MRKGALLFFLALIPALGAAQGPNVQIEAEIMDHEPAPLQSGQYADIWIRVENTGSHTASDVIFEVMDEFPFHVDDRKHRWEIGALGPHQTYLLRAEVRVNENAVFGNNSLRFRTSSDGGETWIERTTSVEVRTDDTSLVVSSVEFPDKVQPGSAEPMVITLENLANSRFQNIDVELDLDDIPVAPGETSRVRVQGIDPMESRTINYTLQVDEDAENGVHKVPIELSYETQAGTEVETDEDTGIVIGGEPDIHVAMDDTDIYSPGRGTATLRVTNQGEGEAKFVEIELLESENYEILSEKSIYLGSMISDGYQTAEFELYVEDGEELELPVEVSYKDSSGEVVQEETVERDLYTGSELDRFGLGGGTSLPVLVGIGLVVVAGGVYYWRRRR